MCLSNNHSLTVMDLSDTINKHIEVDIKNIKGAILSAKEASIGYVTAQGAKMRFMVISHQMLHANPKTVIFTIFFSGCIF